MVCDSFLKEGERISENQILNNEIQNRNKSPLLKYAANSDQVIITPHIGGMTKEAQEIAFNHAAKMLVKYFRSRITNV